MEISFYEINVKIAENNKVYFKSKKKVGSLFFEISTYNLDALEIQIKNSLFYTDEIKLSEKLELNKTYYLIEEDPWHIIGIISLHKGFTFFDCAEHDDRTIIKTAFPDKICNIISEKQ